MKLMSSTKKVGYVLAAITLLATLTGCGGGSGTAAADAPLTGVFLDSPVSGLGYATATHQGITGTGGAFSYENGEMVRFFVGDIDLCTVEAMPVVTPIDCADGAADVTDPMVTNMLVFLQAMDYDNDPENGIDITDRMRQEAVGMHLDFSADPEQFRQNYDFLHFLDLMTSLGMFQNYDERVPPEIVQARSHMLETMTTNGLYGYGPGTAGPGGSGSPGGATMPGGGSNTMGPGGNGGSIGTMGSYGSTRQ